MTIFPTYVGVKTKKELSMSVVRQFFNPELNKMDTYTERYIAEKVQVRDLTVTVTNHYWQD